MSPGVNKNKAPSKHAMDCLARAMRQPYPAQEVNFTVRDKLMQFGYAKLEGRPSPYKTHKRGRMVDYLVCTEKGAAAVGAMR